jgi:hypothetical protein
MLEVLADLTREIPHKINSLLRQHITAGASRSHLGYLYFE